MAMIRPETEMKNSGVQWLGNIVSEFEQPVNIRHTNKESIAPKKIVVFIDNIFMFFLQFYKIYFI